MGMRIEGMGSYFKWMEKKIDKEWATYLFSNNLYREIVYIEDDNIHLIS